MTWSEKVTPSGRLVSRLAASRHHTSGSGSGSWPTPRTPTGGAESGERKQELGLPESGGGDLQAAVHLASWPTPKDSDSDKGVRIPEGAAKELARKGLGADLPTLAASSWPTGPAPHDTDQTAGRARPRNGYGVDLEIAALWATPSSTDYKGGYQDGRTRSTGHEKSGRRLDVQAQGSSWATPTVGDSSGSGNRNLAGSKAHAGSSLVDQANGGQSPRPGLRRTGRLPRIPMPRLAG